MNKKIVLLICLFFSLCLVTGCDSGKKDETKMEVSTRELESTELSDLMTIIDDLTYMDFYNKDIVPRNLTNQEVLRIAYEIVKKKDNSGGISFNTLEDVAMKYLGFSLEPENLNCDTHFNIQDSGGADVLVYDVDTGIYKNNSKHVNHSTRGVQTKVYNEYVEGYVVDDIYTIVVYKVFSELISNNYNSKLNYYLTYNDANNDTNVLFNTSDPAGELDSINKSILAEYTYEFKLKDNNYVLVSYKINT